MYTSDSVKIYDFVAIKFSVKNYRGVWFMSDSLKQKIHNLSIDEAKQVNRQAWKQLKENTRIANRHCNMSISGNSNIYEECASHAEVAQAVAKESYKVMMGY